MTGTLFNLGEGGMRVAGEKDHPRLTPGVHYSLLEDTTQHKYIRKENAWPKCTIRPTEDNKQ